MKVFYRIAPFAITFLFLLLAGNVSAQCDEIFPSNAVYWICESSTVEFKAYDCNGNPFSGTWSIGAKNNVDAVTVANPMNSQVCAVTVGTTVNSGANGSFELILTNTPDDPDDDPIIVSRTYTVSRNTSSGQPTVLYPDVEVCSGVPMNLDVDPGHYCVYHITGGVGITVPADRRGTSTDDIEYSYTNSTSNSVEVIYHITPSVTVELPFPQADRICRASTREMKVTVHPPGPDNVSASFHPSDTSVDTKSVCEGANVQMFGLPSNPMYTYSWSGPNSYSSTDRNSTITSVNSNSFGDYTLTVTDNNSCKGTSEPITLNDGGSLSNVEASFDDTDKNVDEKAVCTGAEPLVTETMYGWPANPTDESIYTYSWSGPNSYTSSARNTPVGLNNGAVGTYVLTVTNTETQCSGTSEIQFTEATPPDVSASFDDSDTDDNTETVCQGVMVNMYGLPSSPPDNSDLYSYSWTNNNPMSYSSSDQNPIVEASDDTDGTYTLVVTNSESHCSNSASIDLALEQSPTLENKNTSICSGTTLAYALSQLGSAHHYTWKADPNDNVDGESTSEKTTDAITDELSITSQSSSELVTYRVKGYSEDNSCPSEEVTVKVLVQRPPSLQIDNTDPNAQICGRSQQHAIMQDMISASDYADPTWSVLSGGGGFEDDNIINATYNPPAGGVSGTGRVELKLQVKGSQQACSSQIISDTYIIQYATKPQVSIQDDSPASICLIDASSSYAFTSVTSDGGAISWNTSGTGTFDNNAINTPTYTPSSSDAGGNVTLEIKITGSGICDGVEASESFTLNVDSLPAIDAGENVSVCPGGDVMLTATGTNIDLDNITWSENGNGDLSSTNALETNYMADSGEGGSSVIATIQAGGTGTCSSQTASDNVMIKVNKNPTYTANDPICAPDRLSVTLSGSYTEATNITFLPNDNGGMLTYSDGSYTISGFPPETGYTITFENTDDMGTSCSTSFTGTPVNCPCEGNFEVAPPSLETLSLSSCYTGNTNDNNSFTVTNNAGQNQLETRWFNENGDTPILTGENSFQPSITDVGVYSYEVQLYNTETNCASNRVSITYTIHALPILNTENKEICKGETLILEATVDNPVTPLTWVWSDGAGTIQSPNSQSTEVFGLNSNAMFKVQVTDGNSCSSTAIVDVKVNTVPTATIELEDPQNSEYCQGDMDRPDIKITLTGGTPYDFDYKKDNETISVDNYNTDIYIIQNAEAGIYELAKVENGCVGTISGIVEIKENTIAPVSIKGSDKICENGTLTLVAEGGSYVNYKWSDGTNSADDVSIQIDAPGTYFVTVTNENGCTATDSKEIGFSKTTAIITPNDPSINLCLGEKLILQASNGGTNDPPSDFQWIGYEDGTSFELELEPDVEGTFEVEVEVENAYECKDTAKVSIVANKPIEADISVIDSEVCDRDTFFLNLENKDQFTKASFGGFGQYSPSTGIYAFVGTQDVNQILVSTTDINGCNAEIKVNDLVRFKLPYISTEQDEINVAVSDEATFDISYFTIDERCNSDTSFTWFIDKKNGGDQVLGPEYETIFTNSTSQLTIKPDSEGKWDVFAVANDACSCASDTLRFLLEIEKSSDCPVKFKKISSRLCVGESVTFVADGKSKFKFDSSRWEILYKNSQGQEEEAIVGDTILDKYLTLEYVSAEPIAGDDNNSRGELTFVCKRPGTYRAVYVVFHQGCQNSNSSKVTVYRNPEIAIPTGAFPDTICYGDVINATLDFPEGNFNYELDYSVNGQLYEGYVLDNNNRDLKLGEQTDKEANISFHSLTSLYPGDFTCTIDDLSDFNIKIAVRDSFVYSVDTDCVNDSISYKVSLAGGQKPYDINIQLPGDPNPSLISLFGSMYSTPQNPVGEYFIGANSQCDEQNGLKKYYEECTQCVPIESAVPSTSLPEDDILVCTNKPYDVVIENVANSNDLQYLVVLQKLNTPLVFSASNVEEQLDYELIDNSIKLTLAYEDLKDIVSVSPNIKYRIVIYPLPSVSGGYKEAPCDGAGFDIAFTYPPSPSINATDLVVCKNQANVILSHSANKGTWIKDKAFPGTIKDFDTENLYLNFTNVNFNDKFDFAFTETLAGCKGSDTITIRVSDDEKDIAPEVKNIYRYPGGLFVYEEEGLCYTWGINNQSVEDFPEGVLHDRYFIFSDAIPFEPYNENKHKVWVEVKYPDGSDCNACTNRVYFNVLTPPKLGHNPLKLYAVTAFPNPVSDNLVIDIKGIHLGKFRIELWNPTGQLIETRDVEKDEHTMRFDYDMSNHIQGLYLMKIIDENGYSNILKVVKH